MSSIHGYLLASIDVKRYIISLIAYRPVIARPLDIKIMLALICIEIESKCLLVGISMKIVFPVPYMCQKKYAEFTGLSVRSVENMIQSNLIASVRKGGRRLVDVVQEFKDTVDAHESGQ